MNSILKFIKITVCLILSISIVFCMAGCRNNPEEISSVIWLDPEETVNTENQNDDSNAPDTSKDNTNKDNTSKDNTSKDNTSKDNTSKDNTSKDNTSKDNTSKDNTSKDNTSKDNTSKDNTSKDNTSKDNTSKDNTSKDNTSKDNENDGNESVAPVPPTQEDVDGEPPVMDLKGRKVVIVGTWDATSTSSPAYKMILELEQKFNCDFIERKMSDYSSLYSSILSGKPICDLFCPSGTTWINLAAKGMLHPLDTLSAINFEDSMWNAATVKETNYNGHVYGMAYNNQIRQVLIYNQTMFKSNGWEDLYTLQKNGQLTWDMLFGIMQKAIKTDSSGKVTRYGLVPEYNINGFGQTMLHANGVAIAKRDPGTKNYKSGLNSQAALNALNTLNKWVKESGAVYDSSSGGWDSGREIFYNSKSAMAVVSYQMFGTINQNADFDIGMVLFPHGPDTQNDYIRYEVLPTLMPAGVKDPNDIAMLWNYWAYLNTGGKKASADEYLKAFGGGESIEATTVKYINAINNLNYFIDDGESLGFDVSLSDVAYGNKTPAEYIAASKNQFNAAIADAFK